MPTRTTIAVAYHTIDSVWVIIWTPFGSLSEAKMLL